MKVSSMVVERISSHLKYNVPAGVFMQLEKYRDLTTLVEVRA